MNNKSTILYYFAFAIFAAASIFLFFYKQFYSGFGIIFGDEFDANIEVFLTSHWFGWFFDGRNWNEPLYFYPHANTLGYNDGYFMYGIISIPFRLIGLDVITSQEMVHVTVKLIGFISMVFLMNHLTQSRTIFSLLGATLFTLIISSSIQASHGQLFVSSFAPLLALLMLKSIEGIRSGNKLKLITYGTIFAAIYSALFLTGFYMAWFSGLFVIIFVLFFIVFDAGHAKQIVVESLQVKWPIFLVVFLFFIFLIPFLNVYLTSLNETGGQGYAAKMHFSLIPSDIINCGSGSFIWGGVFDWINARTPELVNSLGYGLHSLWRGGEFQVGFTPDVIVVLTLILILYLTNKLKNYPRWYVALIFGTLFSLLLPISIAGFSPWYFVDKLIPGSQGARVIARYYIFLAFPVSVLITYFFIKQAERGKWIGFFVFILFSFITLSQINTRPPVVLDARHQAEMIEAVPAPPSLCKSFFTSSPNPTPIGNVPTIYRANIQAMLIADKVGIPTLNGFATFNPRDWNFEYTKHYNENFLNYLKIHQLEGVCMYDICKEKWYMPDAFSLQHPVRFCGSNALYLNSENDRSSLLTNGWSTPETWGVWSNASSALINLPIPIGFGDYLEISFSSHALLSPSHDVLSVNIFVDGKYTGEFIYNYPQDSTNKVRKFVVKRNATDPKSSTLMVEFKIDTPISPQSIGLNDDTRLLGIGLEWIGIDELSATGILKYQKSPLQNQ